MLLCFLALCVWFLVCYVVILSVVGVFVCFLRLGQCICVASCSSRVYCPVFIRVADCCMLVVSVSVFCLCLKPFPRVFPHFHSLPYVIVFRVGFRAYLLTKPGVRRATRNDVSFLCITRTRTHTHLFWSVMMFSLCCLLLMSALACGCRGEFRKLVFLSCSRCFCKRVSLVLSRSVLCFVSSQLARDHELVLLHN